MAIDQSLIRVVVYDLDGTVYDDTRHFELYAREIQSRLPTAVQEAFWTDYAAVLAGCHAALRVGTLYDVGRDLVLYSRNGQVLRALRWDGTALSDGECVSLYPEPVQADHQTVLNVGDLWWVPSAISYHYGGDPAKNYEAFLKVRDIMSDPAFTVRPIAGLAAVISSLRGRVVQVLATNSPQPDSEAILAKVGLLGLFDRMYFRSNKPAGLLPILAAIQQEYGVTPEQILSVGDNLVNEILPTRALGCQTAFIDPHGTATADEADLIVPAMTDLLPVLERLGR